MDNCVAFKYVRCVVSSIRIYLTILIGVIDSNHLRLTKSRVLNGYFHSTVILRSQTDSLVLFRKLFSSFQQQGI